MISAEREREAEILRLYHAEKWRVGTIATQLGVHHSAVQRVLAKSGLALKTVTPRASMLDPYVSFMLETLTKYPRLRASRLFQMARARGYRGGADHFCRHRRVRVPKSPGSPTPWDPPVMAQTDLGARVRAAMARSDSSAGVKREFRAESAGSGRLRMWC